MKLVIYTLLLTCLLFSSGCGTTSSASLSLKGSASKSATETESSSNLKSPKSLVISIYTFYLGLRADCTDLKPVANRGDDSEEYDLFKSPLLFTANPAQDTYHCIAIKMKDLVTTQMNDASVKAWPDVCVKNEKYVTDLYTSHFPDTWKDVDGKIITPVGTDESPLENTITLFASTEVAAVTGGILALPASQVSQLTSPLTVPLKVIFYVDYTNGVNGESKCILKTGTVGFR